MLPKLWDIQWPIGPNTIEAINANFDFLFRRIANLGTGSTAASSGGGTTVVQSGILGISGTPNQVLVAGSDTVVLSLPQSIGTASAVIFSTLSLANPLDEASGGTGWAAYVDGDLLVGFSGGLARLALGDEDDVLTIVSGLPAWAPAAGGPGGGITTASGVANQVVLSGTSTSIIIGTPQDISTASAVQFGSAGLGVAPEAGVALKVTGPAYLTQYDAGSSSASITIDWANGNEQILLLTADCTLTFANPKTGARYVLRLQQNTGAPFTVTWPGTVVWAGAIEPELSQDDNGKDLVAFYYDGTHYIGAGSNASALAQGLPENPLATVHGGTGFFDFAKGHLLAGNATAGLSKVAPPGADDWVLISDDAEATGMKWSAALHRINASVYTGSDITVDVDELTLIEWDNEAWDDDGLHSNVSNPSRITIPAGGDGIYLVTVAIGWYTLNLGTLSTRLHKNGSQVADDTLPAGNWGGYHQIFSLQQSLVAGDYLEVNVYYANSGGGATALTVQGGIDKTFFQVVRVA